MAKLVIPIPKELEEDMKAFPEINWKFSYKKAVEVRNRKNKEIKGKIICK